MIRFIGGNQIDRDKWDACIDRSPTGFVYARSWYLDWVAPGWGGLVKDDYEAIMPLPLRKKFGIHYAFQPPFTQQLGIFAPEKVSGNEVDEFLATVPEHVKYLNFNLNFNNDPPDKGFIITQKVNYDLYLGRNYEVLRNGFSDNTRRNLRHSEKEITIREGIAVHELVRLKMQNPDIKQNEQYYNWLQNFCDKLIEKDVAEITGAVYRDQICAAALFLNYGKRVYYLMPVSDAVGKDKRAMFSIMNYVIQKNSGTERILDFEGSILPGIARFFAGFGARPYHYNGIVMNRLPFWVRCFKKH